MNMKFVKGLVVGSLVSTGIMMMFNDTNNTKKMIKKGRQFVRRLGVM